MTDMIKILAYIIRGFLGCRALKVEATPSSETLVSTTLHGTTTHKTANYIFTAMKRRVYAPRKTKPKYSLQAKIKS
jgi:hypothetical protein